MNVNIFDEMLKEFVGFIDNQELFNQENQVLLAVSGGVDSVVLAHLFKESGFHFSIAHANFQLRGEDSASDEEFVRRLAQQLGIQYYHQKFNTASFASQKGISIQMAARELRYQWFGELMAERGLDYLATAHHKDDIAETVLMNLVRGTGIAGVHGILPKRDKVVRPLLFASKDEITKYASKNGLNWREDVSNADDKYGRNFLRNKVVPLLKQINPSVTDTLKYSADHFHQVEKIYKNAIEDAKVNSMNLQGKDTFINLENLKQNPLWRELLSGILLEYGFRTDSIQKVLGGLNNPGAIFYSGDWQLNIDRDQLIISKMDDQFSDHFIEESCKKVSTPEYDLVFVKLDGREHQLAGEAHIASLDLQNLKYPLTLRKWLEGDSFIPLGMKGKKKLSDFMIDQKIPLNLKQRQLLLISGEDIVWVVGHRISDKYKVTHSTEKVLQIKMILKNA